MPHSHTGQSPIRWATDIPKDKEQILCIATCTRLPLCIFCGGIQLKGTQRPGLASSSSSQCACAALALQL